MQPAPFHPCGSSETVASSTSTALERRDSARRPSGVFASLVDKTAVFSDHGFWAHQGHGRLKDAGGDSGILPRRLVPSAPYLAKPDLAATKSRACFAVRAQAQIVSFSSENRQLGWLGSIGSRR